MKNIYAIYENSTEKELQFFRRLINIMFLYTQEQLSALCGEIPMTLKLFVELLEICIDTDDIDEFFALCDDYPQLFQEHSQQLSKELEMIENFQ